MAGWQGFPPSHTNPLKFSSFQTFMESRKQQQSQNWQSYSFNHAFFICGNHFVLTSIFIIDMVT